MFQDNCKRFITDAEQNISDLKQLSVLSQNVDRYQNNVKANKEVFLNFELARKRAALLKNKAFNEFEHYLTEFEKKFRNNGGRVIWAENSQQVILEIIQILEKQEVNTINYTKSLISEEINISKSLTDFTSVATDMSDFILHKLSSEKKHSDLTLMRTSEAEISEMFHKYFQLRKNATLEEITTTIRDTLRNSILQSKVSVTSADFLVSDCGAVAYSENEGDITLAYSIPKVQIVLAGIEKIIPTLNDLELLWALKAHSKEGMLANTYQSVVFGPKKETETDGCNEMILILVDNNRTELLSHKPQRLALSCIECGACLQVCPVFKKAGSSAYNSAFQGPIGAVSSPFLLDFEQYQHLSFASTLCGKCSEVCPVHIPIHELLLYNRKEAVSRKSKPLAERFTYGLIRKALMSRKFVVTKNVKMKNLALKLMAGNVWLKQREFPAIAEKSFNQLWKEQHPEHEK
jgi:L-lactate dehydrogenase complex protein LldF